MLSQYILSSHCLLPLYWFPTISSFFSLLESITGWSCLFIFSFCHHFDDKFRINWCIRKKSRFFFYSISGKKRNNTMQIAKKKVNCISFMLGVLHKKIRWNGKKKDLLSLNCFFSLVCTFYWQMDKENWLETVANTLNGMGFFNAKKHFLIVEWKGKAQQTNIQISINNMISDRLCQSYAGLQQLIICKN